MLLGVLAMSLQSRARVTPPMTPRSRRRRSLFAASLLLGVVLGCTGIREDELACEDAVSHLQACCTGFSASNIDCSFQAGGCTENTVYPELSVSQSACIRAESCQKLRATGVCERAQVLPSSTAWSDTAITEPDAGPSPQVCP